MTNTVKRHRRRVQMCTGRLVSGPVKFTVSHAAIHVTIDRSRIVYANGGSVARKNGQLLVLKDRRRLIPGGYTLVSRSRLGHRSVTRRMRITLGPTDLPAGVG